MEHKDNLMNVLSPLNKLYSQFTSWLRLRPHKTSEERTENQENIFTTFLEQYFREFDIRNVTVDDQDTLLENIATQLEFHFFMNGISLPEKRS